MRLWHAAYEFIHNVITAILSFSLPVDDRGVLKANEAEKKNVNKNCGQRYILKWSELVDPRSNETVDAAFTNCNEMWVNSGPAPL